MMLQYIHVPVTHFSTTHFSRGGGHTPLSEVIILFVSLLYICYLIGVCMERSFDNLTRKQFILYLLIPFSGLFVLFINLFKED